jgi:hypothetical protein
MNATRCPFCGLITETPHETQEVCIEALQHEIAHVRGILGHVKEFGTGSLTPPSADGEPNEGEQSASELNPT